LVGKTAVKLGVNSAGKRADKLICSIGPAAGKFFGQAAGKLSSSIGPAAGKIVGKEAGKLVGPMGPAAGKFAVGR